MYTEGRRIRGSKEEREKEKISFDEEEKERFGDLKSDKTRAEPCLSSELSPGRDVSRPVKVNQLRELITRGNDEKRGVPDHCERFPWTIACKYDSPREGCVCELAKRDKLYVTDEWSNRRVRTMVL